MELTDYSLPQVRLGALAVWRRNALVWRKLMGPSLMINFGEPFLYLLGMGYGLGRFIGDMVGLPYLTFLASGLVASSAMTTASFEGMYSVHTRMVPQKTYDAMLATPIDIDDIVAGEMLWCATKGLIAGTAILLVSMLFGAISGFAALTVIPIIFLVGLCFAGPALIMSAVSPNYDFFSYYFTLVITPMFILCGVFYPVTTMPDAVQTVIQLLPLTHAVALVRPIVTDLETTNTLLHLLVLAVYAAIGFYLSVILIRQRLFL